MTGGSLHLRERERELFIRKRERYTHIERERVVYKKVYATKIYTPPPINAYGV